MEKELIDKIMLIGEYMNIKYLFPLQFVGEEEPYGVYITSEEDGDYDVFGNEGYNYYSPESDWNHLMMVCKKIIDSYFDDRQDIYRGLNNADIEETFEAVVEFIKFWNDDTKKKCVWVDSGQPDWSIKHCKKHNNKIKSLNKG